MYAAHNLDSTTHRQHPRIGFRGNNADGDHLDRRTRRQTNREARVDRLARVRMAEPTRWYGVGTKTNGVSISRQEKDWGLTHLAVNIEDLQGTTNGHGLVAD